MTGDTLAAESTSVPFPSPVSRWVSLVRGHRLGVGLIALLAAAAYSVLGLVKLATLRASIFDLVIFDQAVRNYAHLRPPYVPVVGAFHDRGLDYVQLADHFSPAYALLAPKVRAASSSVGEALFSAVRTGDCASGRNSSA